MSKDWLLAQTRLRVPDFAEGPLELTPIEKGGSDRRFYRLLGPGGRSLILVQYNLAREENRHYVRIAQFLGEHGIRVPGVYFHDGEQGLVGMEDLGEQDLFGCRDRPWPALSAFYSSAVEQIAGLHSLPESEWAGLRGEMPPEFDAALYSWEQRYFFDNCLGRIFQLEEANRTTLSALPVLSQIAARLASLPRVLVHRDFQSQNILLRDGEAFLIDFQGMRPGLAEYDVASLLYDPYMQLRSEQRAEVCARYLDVRALHGDQAAQVKRILPMCAMQRLMQALGAYAFLGLEKRHRQFLQYVPAALVSLREVVAQIDGLAPLGAALAAFSGDALRTI